VSHSASSAPNATNSTAESPDVASRLQLYRKPPGPVLQGDSLKIVCRVADKHPLDIVRLVRHPLNSDSRHSEVITTNGIVQGRFKDIGRYNVTRWHEAEGLVELQITGEAPRWPVQQELKNAIF